jgi:hypothetical protein
MGSIAVRWADKHRLIRVDAFTRAAGELPLPCWNPRTPAALHALSALDADVHVHPQDEKNSMRAELQMADAQREKLREDAKAMRASLQFVKLEHIDEEIDKLENRISHTTLSIDEVPAILPPRREGKSLLV